MADTQRLITGLHDISDVPISDMNSSWVTKGYSLGPYLHICLHLIWSNPSPVGVLTLEYSCDEVEWEPFNVVSINGSTTSQMFLDSNLAVLYYRLRFTHTSGSATLLSYLASKRY